MNKVCNTKDVSIYMKTALPVHDISSYGGVKTWPRSRQCQYEDISMAEGSSYCVGV